MHLFAQYCNKPDRAFFQKNATWKSRVYTYFSKTSFFEIIHAVARFLLCVRFSQMNISLVTVVVVAYFLYMCDSCMRHGMNFKFQPRNGIRRSNFKNSTVLSFCSFLSFSWFFFLLYLFSHFILALSYLGWCTYNIGCAPRFVIS